MRLGNTIAVFKIVNTYPEYNLAFMALDYFIQVSSKYNKVSF